MCKCAIALHVKSHTNKTFFFLLPKPGCVAAGLKDGSAGGGDAMCRLWKLYISIQVFKLLLVTVILGVHDLRAFVVVFSSMCLFWLTLQSSVRVYLSVCSTQMAAGPKSGSSLLLHVGVPHLLCSMLLVLLMLNPR